MRATFPALPVAFLALAAASPCAVLAGPPAGKAALTLERVHAPEPLVEAAPTGLRWRDSARFTYLKREGPEPGARASLWQVDAATGKAEKLLDAIPAEGTGSDGKPRSLPLSDAKWNEAGTALVAAAENDLWLYTFGAGPARRLTADASAEELPLFYPTARRSRS